MTSVATWLEAAILDGTGLEIEERLLTGVQNPRWPGLAGATGEMLTRIGQMVEVWG